MQNSAAKRLLRELKDLQNDPSPEFTAKPVDDELFDWHFTIRGPPFGGFEGGRYHGRIMFPTEYPYLSIYFRFKPPNIIFLTPNGRFQVDKKICLSITAYHPESWSPNWGIRTALIAIISFFGTKAEGSVGGLDWTEEERRKCASESINWKCKICGSVNADALPSEDQVPGRILEADPALTLLVKENTEPAIEAPKDAELPSNSQQEQTTQPVGLTCTENSKESDEATPKNDVSGIVNEIESTGSTAEKIVPCSQPTEVSPNSKLLWNIDLALLCIFVFLCSWFYSRFG